MLGKDLLAQLTVSLLWAKRYEWKSGTRTASNAGQWGSLWYVQTGCLDATLNGTRWTVAAGTALLLPRGMFRDRLAADGDTLWWSVGLDALLFGRLDVLPLLHPPVQWRPDAETRRLLEEWMDHAVRQWRTLSGEWSAPHIPDAEPRDEQALLIGDGLARAIFGLCWRALSVREPQEDLPLRVTGAPDWLIPTLWAIQEDPALTPTQLCARFAVSPAHLRRCFHRFVGVSPQAYLSERRLERACRLLRGTHMTVAAVGEAIGFDSVYTFSRVFTERFHMPPSKWREERSG